MKSIIKLLFSTVLILSFQLSIVNAQIAINSDGQSPDASAMFDITSYTKGVLIPRMPTSNRTGISSPATGLLVFDTDYNSFWYYNGSAWAAIGANNGFTSENGLTYSNNNSDEHKFFFDQSKAAFRVGMVDNSNWNESNIGNYSFGGGYKSRATADYSFAYGNIASASGEGAIALGASTTSNNINSVAIGYASNASGIAAVAFNNGTASNDYATAFSNAIASGNYATAFSESTASGDYATAFNDGTASGDYSTAFGLGTTAKSYGEFAIGMYNTTYTPNDAIDFDSDDRMFVVGNGTYSASSDAFTIYKSGNAELNGTLAINEDATSADASAILDISSSDKGVLVPRMTTAERTAIASPATSLLVYDTNEGSYWYYENNIWNEIATRASTDLLEETTTVAPEYQTSFDLGNSPVGIAASGHYLYILEQGNDQIRVVNIAAPNNPTSTTTFKLTSTVKLKDIAISGDYAYVVSQDATSDLWVFDISTPANIDTIGGFDLGDDFSSIDIDGDYAYITDCANDKLLVIDISTPSSPTQVGEIANMYAYSGSTDNLVLVENDYAYVIHDESNSSTLRYLSIIDVSTPSSPTLISTSGLGTTINFNSIAKYNDYLYLDSDGSSVFYPIDVSNTASINFSVRGGNTPTTILVSGDYLYINSDTYADLAVYDLSSNPGNPSVLYSVESNIGNISYSSAMVVSNGHLYTITGGGELVIHRIASFYVEGIFTDGSSGYYDLSQSLGSFSAVENMKLSDNWLSNDGDDEGLSCSY